MATSSLQLQPINSLCTPQIPKRWDNLSNAALLSSAASPSIFRHKIRHIFKGGIRMQVVEEEYEVKQMRDMAAARKRWEALVRDGKVNVLSPREAGYAIQLSKKTLLDVRPSPERKKAWVKGSTWIPIFDIDDQFNVGTLSRKITGFVMGGSLKEKALDVSTFLRRRHIPNRKGKLPDGNRANFLNAELTCGWWSGVPILSYNKEFIPKVAEKFSKDTDLIVACQKGMRSLAACELLYNAGYKNLFWVQGGLEAAEEEDLEREGSQPFKLAGIGGLSEFLGWTDQQRAAAANEGLGYRLVFSARLIGLIVAVDALFLGAQQVGQYLQEIRSH
ncbi:rhodanese-like domain-containing protein 11, chloroplastic [Dorcoceras hygrometricum]|uniref:Rhodanese-like domain-containing protein 11, chloroplastic n=1 Tax=Dorcoceras hygrometricum TaxID=472368 RepID=A0A2Z7AWA3_9LAMI|nr:rhodanese-like domain-containing protein 11, chloroplastic [Dorcoceras hygrometricum]